MKYPILNYRLIFNQLSQDDIEMIDPIKGTSEFINDATYQRFMAFDGKTSPYQIFPNYSHSDVDMIIESLIKRKLLLKNPYFVKDDGYMINFYVRNRKKPSQKNFSLIVKSLVTLAPIAFVIAMYYFNKLPINLLLLQAGDHLKLFFMVMVALFISLVFHEYAHSLAIRNYGLELLSVGIKFDPFITGYNEYAYDNKLARRTKFDIAIIGISMNICLSSICFALSYYLFNEFLFLIATQNLAMGLINLGLNEGLDGAAALEALLDIDSLEDLKKSFKKIKISRKLFKNDVSRIAMMVGMAIILLTWINIPIIVLWCFIL